MSAVKILLISTTNQNFGDTVITENTKYLLHKAFPFWKKNGFEILTYSFKMEDLWQIRFADAIVFAGGGLIKFKQENYYRWVADIIKEAQKYDVPVFMNSVGVESFDPLDERCMMLKEAVNLPCVKGISIRDDIETFKKYYCERNDLRICPVFDPAVWSKQAYEQYESKRTEYVGLGVARGKIFADYGNPQLDEETMIAFWKDVIRELDQKGIRWKIFTNGLNADEDFAEKLLESVGHGEKAAKPIFAEDLVGTLTTFRSIIACRMHANILAYSFGIPSIGLVWNHKLEVWGEKIGYTERFLQPDEINADIAVQRLLQAEKEGCKGPGREQKSDVYKELRWFVKNWCKKKNNPISEKLPDPSAFMAAAALGGASFKYRNMNSLQVLEQSYKEGFRIFEIDVRLTSDEKLVCVNGWSTATYKALNIEAPEQSNQALTYEEFKKCRYYNYYKTAAFDEAAKAFANYQKSSEKDLTLIIDVGKPKKEYINLFFRELTRILRKNDISENSIILRLQRNKDIKAFQKCSYNCRIAHCINENEDPEIQKSKIAETLSFCEQENIHLIWMKPELYTEEMANVMRKHQMECIVFSSSKLGDAFLAAKKGAMYAGSYYYSPGYAHRLTGQ